MRDQHVEGGELREELVPRALSRRGFLRRLAGAAAALTVGGMAADELLELLEQPTDLEWQTNAGSIWTKVSDPPLKGRKDAFYAYGRMYAELIHPKPFTRSWP